jgi:hypothetical protein
VSVRTYGPVRFSLGADSDLSRWSIAGLKMKSGKPHDERLSGLARHHAWQDTPALFTTDAIRDQWPADQRMPPRLSARSP